MEPQEQFCCYETKCKKDNKRNCLGIVTIILLTLFALVIGLLIGAALSTTILGALPAIIILAIVLGILLLLTIIMYFCKRDKKCCC